jgi:flavin reductase (DIM6/NTAB) family NADH-FMN oxidoreductase RutF
MAIDPRELRNTLGKFATGVCVITTRTADGHALGLTANSFSSVSLDPPLVLWSLQNNSEVYTEYATPQYFAVNVLAASQEDLSNLYARKGEHLMDADHFSTGTYGSPLIEGALACFQCELETTHEGGDHLIIVGRVLEQTSQEQGEPLCFFSGGYRQLA